MCNVHFLHITFIRRLATFDGNVSPSGLILTLDSYQVFGRPGLCIKTRGRHFVRKFINGGPLVETRRVEHNTGHAASNHTVKGMGGDKRFINK